MLKITGIINVNNYIEDTFDEYAKYALDIFKHYAAEVVKYFLTVQLEVPAETKGEFWTNHTFKAAKAFFAHSWVNTDERAIVLTMDYDENLAPYVASLELEHNKRFAALPHLLIMFYPAIEHDLKVLYGEI